MEIVITKLQYISYLGFLCGAVGIMTSYVIAVSNGDVQPWLPYISDAGGDPPQSSIFSFSMILVSLCFLVGCCVCYMIMVVMNSTEDFYVKWLSRLIPLAGAGCSAGMVLLAVNPVGHLRRDGTWLYPIFVPHMVGAVGMFASGISLMWILAWCYYLLDYGAWKTSFYTRCLIAIVGIISGILSEPSSHVYGALVDGVFHGAIQSGSGRYYVENARRFFSGPKPFHSVLYDARDARFPDTGTPGGWCGVRGETERWMDSVMKSRAYLATTAAAQRATQPKVVMRIDRA